jgi:hypothetical protein
MSGGMLQLQSAYSKALCAPQLAAAPLQLCDTMPHLTLGIFSHPEVVDSTR